MQEFWSEIKKRVQELLALDYEHKLVFGSTSHKYDIVPPVSLNTIEAYEAVNDTQLPESYRSYLQFFGSGGCGPYCGIRKFPEQLWQGDLSKPLKQEIVRGFQFFNDPIPSLAECDGMIQFGVAGVGEAQFFLVVNGPLYGHVVGYNWADMFVVCGPFDKWYERWIDCAFLGIRQFEVLKHIKVGDQYDVILEHSNLKVSRFHNNHITLMCTNGSIKICDKGLVKEVNLEYPPVGKSGFDIWPYCSLV